MPDNPTKQITILVPPATQIRFGETSLQSSTSKYSTSLVNYKFSFWISPTHSPDSTEPPFCKHTTPLASLSSLASCPSLYQLWWCEPKPDSRLWSLFQRYQLLTCAYLSQDKHPILHIWAPTSLPPERFPWTFRLGWSSLKHLLFLLYLSSYAVSV